MSKPQNAAEIVQAAHAESAAEARLARALDRDLALLGQPTIGCYSLGIPLTPEARGAVLDALLGIFHRAGMTDALRAVLTNLAVTTNDRELMAALGVSERGDDKLQNTVTVIPNPALPHMNQRLFLPEGVPSLAAPEPIARELVRRVVESETDHQLRNEP